jgi:hypothetical protein
LVWISKNGVNPENVAGFKEYGTKLILVNIEFNN